VKNWGSGLHSSQTKWGKFFLNQNRLKMKGFIGVTDNDWFAFLSQQPGIDEVNFWQPGGTSRYRRLDPGEPFFFRLRAPLERYLAAPEC